MAPSPSGPLRNHAPDRGEERRRAPRYPVALAVRVNGVDGQPAAAAGVTRNASRSGVLFQVDGIVAPADAPIEFDLAIGESALARCSGRVVRSEVGEDGRRCRVAATIERYRIGRADA